MKSNPTNATPFERYQRIKELNDLYDENKERYRYGKGVCSLVKSKIQRKIRTNPDLFQDTDYIKVPQLLDIVKEVWG
jgi:hypothetical protein